MTANRKKERRATRAGRAQLTFTGSDWSIEDLNSTNGTLVNNRRITRCPLRNGDLLTFGLSTFEFRG